MLTAKPAIKIGNRFTYGFARYDKRVWKLMRIDKDTYPTSGEITTYCCNAEGTVDWFYMQNPEEKIASRQIKIIAEEGLPC